MIRGARTLAVPHDSILGFLHAHLYEDGSFSLDVWLEVEPGYLGKVDHWEARVTAARQHERTRAIVSGAPWGCGGLPDRVLA